MNAEFEAYLMLCTQRQLEAMMCVIQARLGTPGEQAGDFERVAAIAHRLNNVVMELRLREQLRKLLSEGHEPGQ